MTCLERATAQSKHEMERGTAFERVVRGSFLVGPILCQLSLSYHLCSSFPFQNWRKEGGCKEDVHLLATKDQSLLNRWNTLFLLDLLLNLGDLYTD